jgi:uncharacterized protein
MSSAFKSVFRIKRGLRLDLEFHSLFLFVMLFSSLALSELKVPELTDPVMDQVGIMNSVQVKVLSQQIRSIKDQGGPQLSVLIVDSLEGEPIESFSIRVVDKWKLGDAKTDRGLLILLAMKDRKIRIEVGQGLEGDITDLLSRRIISEQITPAFRAGKFAEGIQAAIARIVMVSDPTVFESVFGKNGAQQARIESKQSTRSEAKRVLFFMFLFLGITFLRVLGARSSGRGGYRRSGWMGSGGLGGGFGGGGWSGGGGGFSGGGSSGSW